MISTLDIHADKVAAFRLQHYIDEPGLKKVVQEMEEKASQNGKVLLYFEFVSFGGWDSVQSFFDTLKLKFNSWDKIARYAIVTDKEWVQKQSRLANFLTPHFDVKAFNMEQKEEAIAWLTQPIPDVPEPGIAVLEAMPRNVVGLATVGKITASDYQAINCLMEEQTKRNPDLRLYLEVLHLNGVTPAAMWEDLKTGLKYYSKFSKIAVAGHEDWLQKATTVADKLTPGISMKYFKLDERDTAIDWLQ